MNKPILFLLSLAQTLALTAGAALADAPGKSLRPVLRPAGVATGVTPNAPKTFKAAVSTKAAVPAAGDLIAAAKLGGDVAYAVADAKTGLILESGNGDLAQPPASVTKSVTALYALDTLGPSHRFETRLIATGAVRDGVLMGDLVLEGGGDPTLDTNALAAMAADLKRKGVREVRGKFLVWGGALPKIDQIDPGQPDHVSYNAAVSGIALNFNRVHFSWTRGGNGWVTSMDARSNKYRPEVTVATMQVVNRAVPVYTYKSRNGRDQWTVASKALGKGGTRWLPVRQPEIYAGEVFRTFARSQGITLKQPELTNRHPGGGILVTHRSDDLRTILRDMLKYSNNLTAEMVGLAATAKRTGRVPASLHQSAAEMTGWAKASLGMGRAKLVDHSGLEDDSRLTASDMARALVKVRGAGLLKPILKPVSMRDSKGRPIKGHPIKVVAKTGTLNFVSSLAGYMEGPDGTEMTFAIFTANQNLRAKIAKGDEERPQGSGSWNARAKRLQQRLIERWGALYGE
ncbi:D-alanyl-D-alanine carboxypeptidase/D-alanyl-D-alanine endopeptidase [Rhodalgimonas zhirmunskyi]|uniref:D-alanyl-D-alanine carboxypeptidase/D-alanyl-D-alanine-endopeptidase n=1 Tax=Rhodalgimonas zhirmunskyi TaxID=2964767 RepID=A0AAJ1U6H0_9RHOB|nr:D-alanyl-D-alanine carboxypeptidase/D-alanyl-D-alanine-endopeptidase [Rhodoalgimonas zhirmunskyi]MDQ2093914.1 D-alanyl-D-alanine carboxypeptidase/D-alanyl-D-alanine-endopeptidase [Rhodoalgimonas zhirmunskyi]